MRPVVRHHPLGSAGPMLKSNRSSKFVPYIALAAITAFMIVFVLKLPMSRLDVPYTFEGDGIDKVAQIRNVAETGWLFHNDRLGYPFGYDRLDFPRFDSLNYAIMGPIAAVTGQPGLAMNLYYIAGFFLIGFAGFHSFRHLGLKTEAAFVCALVYTFLPYHVTRGVGHLTNGAYFLVPLGMLALVWVARNELDGTEPVVRRRRLIALIVALLLPLQTPYNGVFFAALCLVAGATAVAQRPRWRSALPAMALIFAVASAFIIELAPVLLHRKMVGEQTFSAARIPIEAETYSLHLNQLLLPPTGYRIAAVAQAKFGFDHAMDMDTPYTEVSNQYLGVFGVLGFAALFWALARAVSARRAINPVLSTNSETAVQIAALLAIAVLVLAMSSGACTLIAYWITSKIRAYNRILPFFAFPCLLGGGWALQALLQRVGALWPRRALIAAITIVALFDVTVLPPFTAHAAAVAAYDRDRDYFESVEKRLGEGATVFQLPVVWYPEYGPLNRMSDYEEFKPFLMTNSLRFSYGAAHGRTGYSWGKFVENQPPADMIARAHSMGFSAILIDGNAYADDQSLNALTSALTSALPQPPSVSPDRRWWLFPLEGCCGAPVPQIEPDKAPRLFDYAADGTSVRFDESGAGRLYIARGWWDPENWGTWSSDGKSLLRMRLDPRPKNAMVVTLDTRMMLGRKLPQRELRIEANGVRIGEASYTEANPIQKLRLDLPEGLVKDDGVLELRFIVTPRATPWTAGVADDDRLIGVGLTELRIAPTASAHR